MDLEVIDLGGNTVKIVLSGRLDTPGDRLETRFIAECAATSGNAIIDLSNVTSIASLGIRMFKHNIEPFLAQTTKFRSTQAEATPK